MDKPSKAAREVEVTIKALILEDGPEHVECCWPSLAVSEIIDRAIQEAAKPLVEALREIAGTENMTLLGQSPEHEYIPRAYPGEERAHESGANKAFGQCAALAQQALRAHEGDSA